MAAAYLEKVRAWLLLLAMGCGPGVGTYRARYFLEHAGCCSESCFSSSVRGSISLTLGGDGRAWLRRDRQGWSVVSAGAPEVTIGDRLEGAPHRELRDLTLHSDEVGRWSRRGRATLIEAGDARLRCRRAAGRIICRAEGDWRGFSLCGDIHLDDKPGLVLEKQTLGFGGCD